MAMAARTTAVVSFAICFIFGVGCSWRGAVANGDGSWGGCVDNGSSCGVAFKLSNRFFGARCCQCPFVARSAEYVQSRVYGLAGYDRGLVGSEMAKLGTA
jgi:hypothetical protein